MSVSQLLQPNNFDLFCKSITTPNSSTGNFGTDLNTVRHIVAQGASGTDIFTVLHTPTSLSTSVRIDLNLQVTFSTGAGDSNFSDVWFRIKRNGVTIKESYFEFSVASVADISTFSRTVSLSFVDLPTTAAEVTYTLDLDNENVEDGVVTVNPLVGPGNNIPTQSQMIVTEL